MSNLSILCKLLEKAVAFRVKKYMNTHRLRDVPEQSAYKASHSIEIAWTNVHNDLLNLGAAFDIVDTYVLDRKETLLGNDGVVSYPVSEYICGFI